MTMIPVPCLIASTVHRMLGEVFSTSSHIQLPPMFLRCVQKPSSLVSRVRHGGADPFAWGGPTEVILHVFSVSCATEQLVPDIASPSRLVRLEILW